MFAYATFDTKMAGSECAVFQNTSICPLTCILLYAEFVTNFQDADKHRRLKIIMSDRPDLINSEMGGVAFNSIDACFKQADLKRMFNFKIQLFISTGTTFFVTVDPAAGGEHSDFAIVSFTMLHGIYKVFIFFCLLSQMVGNYDTSTIFFISTKTVSMDAALCCVVIRLKKSSSDIDIRIETAVCGFRAVNTTFCPRNGFLMFVDTLFVPPMTNSIFFLIILSRKSVSLLFCCVLRIQCLIFESIERKKKKRTTI